MSSLGFGRPTADPVQVNRNQFIDALMSTPDINQNGVSGFLVKANATTQGVDVSFKITDITGISAVSLFRATVMDIKQATALQTWTAAVSSFTWSDTDSALQASGQAYYWLRLEPKNVTGSEVNVGPQYILLNPSLLPPVGLAAVSASHAAAVNGTVKVTVNVSAIPSGDSVKIYVTGYLGNPSAVAVAQRSSAPLQFNLEATGETITIKAIAVSPGGSESSTGPTCTLTLNGSATAPARIQGVTVAQLSTGNQIMWPSSLEAGVTGYDLYRGPRGQGFGAATLLIHLAASSAGEIIYLDTAGLTGDFEYYVIADSAAGNSPASIAANPIVLYSSSQLPPNTPSNQIGAGTLDSIDGGSSATIRIYGPGGVGTGWTKITGYGTASRPAGSITGLAYSTQYYVLFNVAAATYIASVNYTDTMPDEYEWIGTLSTAPSGGAGATTATAGAALAGTLPGTYPLASVFPITLGYGYGSATVTLTPGGGAVVLPICQHGQVVGYTISNPGSFSVVPTVTVNKTSNYTGGGSTGGGSRYVLTNQQ